jgi:hypothetical protein
MPKTTDWLAVERKTRQRAHAQEIRELKAELEKFAEAHAEAEKRLDIVLSLKGGSKKTIKPIVANPLEQESQAVAVAVASDWHVEESVDPRTISGLNEFNLDIADARIEKFFQSVIRLTNIERQGTKIDTLVLAMLGDFMTGFIHEELQETNALTPTQTVLWLMERITKGVEMLKRDGGYSRIVIPCSYGNHGRNSRKPRHGSGAANSYEWMMYKMLERSITGVEWQVSDGYHNYLEVFGRTLRLHHGDNIAYQGGVGGITISVEKAIASWNKARVADLDVFGHHHTQQQNPRWIGNGSLIGYGGYALSIKAPFEPPQQTFFLVDSKRGRTGTWPIFLD